MKALCISGGATKFIALIAATKELKDQFGFNPDYFFGVSSGAITSFLAAMGKHQEGIDIALEMDIDTIFSKRPINKKGKITIGAIIRVLRGKNYLGEMGNLERLLRYVVTEHEFYDWSNDHTTPSVGVLAVNATTKERKMFMLKNLDYETAIKAVMASSSIPLVTPAVEIEGQYYYDGGLRDHSPGPYVLEKKELNITELVSVYSRPEKLSDLKNSDKWKKSIGALFSNVILDTMNFEISNNDHFVETELSDYQSTKYKAIFIPQFMNHLFDTDQSRLKKGYDLAVAAVRYYYTRS